MVTICVRMLRIPNEWLEFAFECLESLSNGSNLYTNASNFLRTFRILIQMLRISFEWFEFAFKCHSNDSSLHLNALKPFRMLGIRFEWLEFAFQCFKSLSNGSNLLSNVSNPFQMVQILI